MDNSIPFDGTSDSLKLPEQFNDGQFHHVAIWHRALSPGEVNQVYIDGTDINAED